MLEFNMERDASGWYCTSRCDGNLHEWKQQEQQAVLLWLQKTSTVLPIEKQALFSHLVSVSFGIFVDFRQGQVGVEFISVFLWYEK